MTLPPDAPPDPDDFLPVLRDLEATEPARARAWGDFVAWLYSAHYRPHLEARLRRRIEQRGLLTRFAPCDVFSRFCYQVRRDPSRLGARPVPTRTWLRRQLEAACRDLERHWSRRDAPRARLRTPEGAAAALELGTPVGAPPEEGPEAHLLVQELEAALRHELSRLEREQPRQHAAWLLGAAGQPYRDISRALSTSVGNVKSLVSRARATLRARLAAYLDADDRGEPS